MDQNTRNPKSAPRLDVHFSSATDNWETPLWLFESLDRELGFTLDPCADHRNAKCKRYFSIDENGLAQSLAIETVFMNPPYGRNIGRWVRKAFESTKDGARVVCLIPARTDTKWWHDYVMRGEVRLYRGRLRFGDAKSAAPFPSAAVVFRASSFRLQAFEGRLESQ